MRCLLLVLWLLPACGAAPGAGDALDTGLAADGFDVVPSDIPTFECPGWKPYPLETATGEACVSPADGWRECQVGGVPGRQRCRYVETAEDQGEDRWGPCEPTCAAADVGVARDCPVNDAPGVQYCNEVWGLDAPIWHPCVPSSCLVCIPGDQRLCGPGTNYPDTLIRCGLSDGIPQWFAGDCTT